MLDPHDAHLGGQGRRSLDLQRDQFTCNDVGFDGRVDGSERCCRARCCRDAQANGSRHQRSSAIGRDSPRGSPSNSPSTAFTVTGSLVFARP